MRRLESGGPIVGLFEQAPFEEETVRLSPGDRSSSSATASRKRSASRATSSARDASWTRSARSLGASRRPFSSSCSPASASSRRAPAGRRHHGYDHQLQPDVLARIGRRAQRSSGSASASSSGTASSTCCSTRGVRNTCIGQAQHELGRGEQVTMTRNHGRREAEPPSRLPSGQPSSSPAPASSR